MTTIASATPGASRVPKADAAGKLLAGWMSAAVLLTDLGLGAGAAGDLLYGSGSNTLARLGIGAAGQLLVAGASAPAWSSKLTLTSSSLTVGNGSEFTSLVVNTQTAVDAMPLRIQVGGVDRWYLRKINATEGGANAGSDLALSARADNGAVIDNVVTFIRQGGGAVTFARPVSATSLTATGLTTGRVTVAGTGGLLQDFASITAAAQALTVGDGTSAPSIRLNGANNNVRELRWQTNGSARCRWYVSSNETGTGDTGSNFSVDMFSDAGAYLDTPIFIYRAAGGQIQLNRPVAINSLTAGRVSFSTTGGLQTDSAGYLFGTSVTVIGGAGFAQTIGNGAATNCFTVLNAAAGQNRKHVFQSAGVNRWAFGTNAAAESTGDAGTAFVVDAYGDAGAYIDSPLTISRVAGGAITLSRPVACGSTLLVGIGTSGNGLNVHHSIGQIGVNTYAGSLPASGDRLAMWAFGATAANQARAAITSYASENWVSGGVSGCDLRFETVAAGTVSSRTLTMTMNAAQVTCQIATDATTTADGGMRAAGGLSVVKSIVCAGTAGMFVNIANSTGELRVNGTKVVSVRKTGWTAQTATAARTDLGASPTVGAIASFLRALYDDLAGHGLIGA